jgi:predicted flavoprotein YhiN
VAQKPLSPKIRILPSLLWLATRRRISSPLVEKHRIPYHEKTLGQLFCDGSARDILKMLEEECKAAGVSVFVRTKIEE